jgi:trans-aconitate 2-methyltransferase
LQKESAGGQYKWDADDYSKSSPMQKKWGRELLSKLQLRGNERVLDIGCGDGALTAAIAERLPAGSVLGIDSSPEMIEFARRKYPPHRFPNLAWEIGDASDLRYENEFDVIFSNAALHWVIDHLPVLRGIKRSLKPGGRILVQMGGRGNAAQVVNAFIEVIILKRWRGYFMTLDPSYSFHGPNEYETWLKDVGLTPKRVALVSKDMTHEGRDGLVSWIRTTWLPFTERVPEELREEFILQIVDRYLEKYPADADGLVHVQAIRLEVEAAG